MRFQPLFAAAVVILGLAGQSLPAADLLYVTMSNNTIVTYDMSLGSAVAVAASAQTFASTNLNSPWGIAFDTAGNVYATSSNDDTISKFNPAGVFQSSITGNLSYPIDIAFDTSGNLYAANYNDSTVSKFNSAGVYQSNITGNQSNSWGLAFDGSGNLYVTNFAGDTISKFNSAGVFQSSIATQGLGVVDDPFDLAFNSAGDFYVSNNNLNNLLKYNSAGVYQSTITGSTNQPSGIVFDSAGNFYVANGSGTPRSISKFDSNGTFQFSWSTGSVTPRFVAIGAAPVPEPSTYALAAIASGVMACIARRRKANRA